MNYAPLIVVGLLAALVLVLAFAGGAFLGYLVSGRRRYDEGQHVGYAEGYAAMKAEHEQYRRDNRAALAAIQNLTPDPNAATLGPLLEPPRTFDTSGAFDVHVETERGARAVARGATLHDAEANAIRFLERLAGKADDAEVVITAPGPNGPRLEVHRVRRKPNGDLFRITSQGAESIKVPRPGDRA